MTVLLFDADLLWGSSAPAADGSARLRIQGSRAGRAFEESVDLRVARTWIGTRWYVNH